MAVAGQWVGEDNNQTLFVSVSVEDLPSCSSQDIKQPLGGTDRPTVCPSLRSPTQPPPLRSSSLWEMSAHFGLTTDETPARPLDVDAPPRHGRRNTFHGFRGV